MTEFEDEPILSTSAMVKWWRKWDKQGKTPQKVNCLTELMDGACKRGTMLAWWGWDYSHSVLPSPRLGLFNQSYWLDEGWDEDLEEDVFIPVVQVDWLDPETVFTIRGDNPYHEEFDGLLFIL